MRLMSKPSPLLHLAAILLLVVPAVFLMTSGDAPAQVPAGATAPRVPLADFPPVAGSAAERGRGVYARYCIGCHGPEGAGDGPAARWLSPPPRNFQSGRFKFRSTPTGEFPTDADLLRTVTCGLAGSAMPGFPLVPESDRRDVVAYVQHLAALGLARREVDYLVTEEGESYESLRGARLAEIRAEAEQRVHGAQPMAVPPAPAATPESIARGKDVFDRLCAPCHGVGGRGDGPSSYTLRDWKDAEIRPRDFTTGVFRAGSSPRDLYMRLRGGLMGTPMPAIPGSDQEIWDQVHYILSMRDPDAVTPHVPAGCGGESTR